MRTDLSLNQIIQGDSLIGIMGIPTMEIKQEIQFIEIQPEILEIPKEFLRPVIAAKPEIKFVEIPAEIIEIPKKFAKPVKTEKPRIQLVEVPVEILEIPKAN